MLDFNSNENDSDLGLRREDTARRERKVNSRKLFVRPHNEWALTIRERITLL